MAGIDKKMNLSQLWQLQNLVTSGTPVIQEQEAAMAVKPIPEGYHSVTPYLIVKSAAKAIDFY
jgi:hypothetical protein